MYIALYRKWRPLRFDDVCGQDAITEILKNEISRNAVSHAYLFCGLRGTGKTTCAKILAKAVNCENLQNGEPCGKCQNCIDAQNGTLLDIVEMDAASNTGVENIRSIIDEVSFLPSQGKRKVYIIDEVHMLSGGAFNALLKTLEEPPEHVIFILCTTETHKIPATILSRCQRFDFGRINADDIIKRLKFIADKEQIELQDSAAALIARLAEGAMRDALSLFELCAGNSKTVDYETACSLLGVPDRDSFHAICKAFSDSDTSSALELMMSLSSKGKATTVCAELIEFFRDLIVVSAANSPEGLIFETPDEIARLKDTAKMFSNTTLLYCISVLEKTLISLSAPNTNARTCLEMTAVRLCNIEKTKDIDALFARVDALERALKSGAAAFVKEEPRKQSALSKENNSGIKKESEITSSEKQATSGQEFTESKPTEQKPTEQKQTEQKQTEQKPVVAKAFERWDEFLDALTAEDKVARSFASMGRAFIKGDELEIIIEDNMSAAMLQKPTRQAALNSAASGVCGRPMTVVISQKKTESSNVKDLLD